MRFLSSLLALFRRGWVVGCWIVCWSTLALSAADAYVLEGTRWLDGQPIVLDLELGNPPGALLDGSTSWNQVAEAAADIWDPYLGGEVQFETVETALTPARRDGKNSVFFSKTIYGEDFGSDTLAVTLISSDKNTGITTEADVIFNSAQAFDSYRGKLRTGGDTGQVLFDLRRVAIHELGHVLGLDHVPQNATSIMTPNITDIDTVQADDVAGVQSIYGVPRPVQPVLAIPPNVEARVGQNFSYQVVSTGPPTNFQASNLPPGLGLDPLKGLISGVPTSGGIFNVILSVSNSVGASSATFTLTVIAPPVITSVLEATARLDQPFSYQITATDQPTSYAVTGVPIPYSVNTGPGLPASLSVDAATGLISGYPTVPGTFSVLLSASNSAGAGQAVLVLKITLTDDSLVTLHNFQYAEGSPNSQLVQTKDGNFYGTAFISNSGTVYRTTPDGTSTVLHTFTNGYDPVTRLTSDADGYWPKGVLQASDGNLYGVTTFGANGLGTIFRLTLDGVLTTLHAFSGEEGGESSPLVQGSDGCLYGVTRAPFDGYSSVSIFKLAPGGKFTTLHLFNTQGIITVTPLIQATDGSLYGVIEGIENSNGTVFRCTPAGVYTEIYQFQGTDGKWPSSLMQASDGNLYGTTAGGGANNCGSIFKLTLDGTLTTLHNISAVEGTAPSSLVQATDGNFYGTAAGGGDNDGNASTGIPGFFGNGKGTVFVLTPAGRFATLYIFDGSGGTNPNGGLILGSDGYLYGVTAQGNGSSGTIFRKGIVALPVVQPPTISAVTTTPEIIVGHGEIGLVNLTLTNAPSTDLIVNYTVKGSAVNGTDYAWLKGTVKFKAGKTSKTIKVRPMWGLGGLTKKVKITLAAGDGYVVGTTQTLKIKVIGFQ